MTEARKYGWKRDLPDARDLTPKLTYPWFKKLPEAVDLRSFRSPVTDELCMPEVRDQSTWGSCVMNACGDLHHFIQKKEGNTEHFVPSRMFGYFNARVLLDKIDAQEDSGTTIRSGMKALGKYGICPESMWPYDADHFSLAPDADCYDVALRNQALKYFRVGQNLRALKSVLADGYPIAYGFSVFSSFSDYREGIVDLPHPWESFEGGHAVLLCGYNDNIKAFLVRNSWGTSQWGIEGYFWHSYEYVINHGLAADFWTIADTEGPG